MGVRAASALAGALMASLTLVGCGTTNVAPSAPTMSAKPATLPAGLPADAIPAPGDFVLTHSMTVTINDEKQYVLTYRKPGSDADAVRGYLGEMKNDGFTLKDGYPDSSNVDGGIWVLTNTKWRVGVAASVTEGETRMVLKVAPK